MQGGRKLSTVPSETDCLEILREEGVPPKVVRHILTVTSLAVEIAMRCNADVPLVRAGALLHDVGRARTHGVRHAIEGASIIRGRGLPGEVVLIVQKHMGAGFTSDEAKEMGLPPGDYMPAIDRGKDRMPCRQSGSRGTVYDLERVVRRVHRERI